MKQFCEEGPDVQLQEAFGITQRFNYIFHHYFECLIRVLNRLFCHCMNKYNGSSCHIIHKGVLEVCVIPGDVLPFDREQCPAETLTVTMVILFGYVHILPYSHIKHMWI